MKFLHKGYIYERIDLNNPIKGGIGDNKKVDSKELHKGELVEREHVGALKTKEKVAVARDIARDHIAEFPDYYEHLEKMENDLEKEHGIKDA